MSPTLKSRRPEVPTAIAYRVMETGEQRLTQVFPTESSQRTFFRVAASHGMTVPLYVVRVTRRRSNPVDMSRDAVTSRGSPVAHGDVTAHSSATDSEA